MTAITKAKLVFGSDHAGFQLKSHLIDLARKLGYDVIDKGTHDEHSVDYPDYVKPVVDEVYGGALGVLICGSGIGISIGANRFQRIRAALCHDTTTTKLSRQHNDANILVLGSRTMGLSQAEDCLETFLSTKFEGGRHSNRVDKLECLG